MHDQFEAIVSAGLQDVESKNIDEFNMGLHLVTIVDVMNNPQEYTEDQVHNLFDQIQDSLDIWRAKYTQEILNLTDEN